MDRDIWLKSALKTSEIRKLRPQKSSRHVGESMGYVRELEADGLGGVVIARTYFLVGSECRFSCSMCDLWKYTLETRKTPVGSLVSQVDALHRDSVHRTDGGEVFERNEGNEAGGWGGKREWLKLYNAANFFDEWNVPSEERLAIVQRCGGFERVVVENHAAMFQSRYVRDEVLRFRDRLEGELEIALGLETIESESMRILNKGMRLEQFQDAIEFLQREGVHSRAFVLLGPPGVPEGESVRWAKATCVQAVAWGVERCCVIPTRRGNGWLDQGERLGYWKPPTQLELEQVLEGLLTESRDGPTEEKSTEEKSVGEYPGQESQGEERECGGKLQVGSPDRVRPVYTVDLWDWDLLDRSSGESSAWHSIRRERLLQMNLQQRWIPWANLQSC